MDGGVDRTLIRYSLYYEKVEEVQEEKSSLKIELASYLKLIIVKNYFSDNVRYTTEIDFFAKKKKTNYSSYAHISVIFIYYIYEKCIILLI